MTPAEKFLAVLDRKPITGRVPHFELEFYLTMEAFGRIHPSQRRYAQWNQMSDAERDLHRKDVADLYVQTVKKYELSGLILHTPAGWAEEDIRQCTEHIRKIDGRDHVISLHGDATYSIPDGNGMMEFVEKLFDKPQEMKDNAKMRVDKMADYARRIKSWGTVEALCLCADYCFNKGPFLSPEMFGEFVAPYLKELVGRLRELGFYVVKHTDGNIMPILQPLVDSNPHALHSIDPQGGVDIAEVKRLVGDKVSLIGNVNCALLQTGTDEQVKESVRYALKHGMPGGGYVFATSNCIFTGMALKRYELMLDVWRKEGNYPG